jgi:hypothetical protein
MTSTKDSSRKETTFESSLQTVAILQYKIKVDYYTKLFSLTWTVKSFRVKIYLEGNGLGIDYS